MEYVVDLRDYPQDVVDKFMAEIESKSEVKWASGDKLTAYRIPLNREPTLHYRNGEIYHRTDADRGTVLTRAQFIDKMAELHPKKKQDIREYCKEHRVWAVKTSGEYDPAAWHVNHDKPTLVLDKKGRGVLTWGDTVLAENNFTFPDVPWDKSLIAPDGSMPLMDEKKTVKHFEVGKWYVNVGKNEKVPMVDDKQAALDGKPHKCLKNDIEVSADSHWDFAIFSGVNGGSCNWNPADWIEVPAPENKDDKPHRGDPVFVWDDDFSDTVPVGVSYFHHMKRGKVYVFCDGEPGECYDEPYDHYRKFDASLVGVPMNRWPKE